jgi:hypothetical protein
MDADNVWVFWLAKFVFVQSGSFRINARATDIHGNSQPQTDTTYFDGTNDWPAINVNVLK